MATLSNVYCMVTLSRSPKVPVDPGTKDLQGPAGNQELLHFSVLRHPILCSLLRSSTSHGQPH